MTDSPLPSSAPRGERETTEHDVYPPISDAECDAFERHATEGAQVDLEGEGVKYSVIQPYDLVRFCDTVRSLRSALLDRQRDGERLRGAVERLMPHIYDASATGETEFERCVLDVRAALSARPTPAVSPEPTNG